MPIMKNKKLLYKNSKMEPRPLFTMFLIIQITCSVYEGEGVGLDYKNARFFNGEGVFRFIKNSVF